MPKILNHFLQLLIVYLQGLWTASIRFPMKMKGCFTVLIIYMCYCISSTLAQEILGCGGFVKSDVTIDFSQIEVQLLTSEGMLKYQTECAPNNGYFMVPFVDKGDFILKIDPPKGWLFEPMSVDLHVDGVNDPCTKGKDINFIFKGFTLSGQISSVGSSNGGPTDVIMSLKSLKTQKTIMETQTKYGGAYTFEGVPPGKYDVVASHSSYTFKQHRTEVTVTSSNARCQSDIVVSGFDVHGHVTAQSLPVAGVHLLLFAVDHKLTKEVTGCSFARPPGAEDVVCEGFPHFICSVTSGDDGKYSFPSLTPAQYSIIPFHRGERIQFDVEPRELRFSVSNARVNHEKSFEVTGFSVQGRVLDGKDGKPIKGAKVIIDGTEHDVTDAAGYYTLKHMHSGVFEVTILKEDVQFPQTKMRVGPDTPILRDIVAKSFAMCGKIEVVEAPGSSFSLSNVAVRVAPVGDKTKAKTINADKKGTFCLMLEPGSYSVEPSLTKTMEEDGLVIVPKSIQVKVENSPKKGVSFTQYRGSVTIQLSCIEACKDVRVELLSVRSKKKLKQVVSLGDKQATVQFPEILPGKYTASVQHDDWCWTSESTAVTVSREPREGTAEVARFEQSGYKLVCSISHDIDLKIHYGGAEVNSFPLKKGHNRMCLARPGEYTLEPVSCHRFDVNMPLKYNTARPKPITLHAIAHEAIIAMETTLKIQDDSSDVTMLLIRSSRGKVTKENMKLAQENKAQNGKSGTFIYKLSHWASDNEELEITPSSKVLLFEPSTTTVAMKSAACSEELVRFKGIVGKYLSGQIVPAISNIDISIATVGTNKVLTLKTDKQGKYRVGPLHPNYEYEISANMEDYVMTPVPNKQGDFVAKKLSKLIFKILTGNGNVPLAGVLISVSGGEYRSNNLTGNDGTLTLTKLEPGKYYFKAMMKEYQFNPSSQVIEVEEGAKTEINISGKRVAYSVIGTVTSLNGEAENAVTVRAVARSDEKTCVGSIEEGDSGADGAFRVRGLRPGCQYDIAVRDGAQRFSHVSPTSMSVMTKEEDVEGVKFIAFRQLTTFDLSGNVVTSMEFLPFIKMVLCRANDSACTSPVHTVSLPSTTPFFHFPTLSRDDSEYMLKLECTLAKSMYDYTEPAAGFFAAGPHKHITFRFEPRAKKIDTEIPQVSLLTFPFTLLVIFLAYNHTTVISYIQAALQLMSGKRDNGPELRTGRRQKK